MNRDTDPQYMLRNGEDLCNPRFKYQYLKSHPLFYFPNLWNRFKTVFKTVLLTDQRFPVI